MIDASGAPVINAFRPPAKFERKIGQEAMSPKTDLRSSLQSCATGLNEVLVEFHLSLDKRIAPIPKQTEA